jgi:hypothetical protein
LAKLLRWCYCKSRVTLGNKPQHYAVVEALGSFIMTPTSVSIIYKVFDNLHMLWMYISVLYHASASLISKASQILPRIMDACPVQEIIVLCSDWGFRPILFIYRVFHNLHMLWMYTGMRPYHVTTSLINQALRILLRILDKNVGQQTTALCGGWGSGLIEKAHISISNIFKVFDNLYMLWMCQWMWPYHVTVSLLGQVSHMLLPTPGNPGQRNKPQHYAVVEALDSFIMIPTSVSNICKVVDNLYMLWMFILSSSLDVT